MGATLDTHAEGQSDELNIIAELAYSEIFERVESGKPMLNRAQLILAMRGGLDIPLADARRAVLLMERQYAPQLVNTGYIVNGERISV
jgi:hypothetical protein